MTRAFSGAISGGGSGPDTIAINAVSRIIENIIASGDTNKRLVETLEKLINLRDVVKNRQERNGNRANAELNSERVGMEKERSQAQGQTSEPAVAERDFHNKNCCKLGQI
ncbi:hypothetical protein DPMN_025319 [Dreissena polymorpha]|uniref:Uncharacterized protein n=1 Tax=Dreissena polymorpha TaxID=45954 RepID=A0A9D4LRD0_DREPO|nr:hypothetical protein DPMN_025319 [Dreissena polymorpha]